MSFSREQKIAKKKLLGATEQFRIAVKEAKEVGLNVEITLAVAHGIVPVNFKCEAIQIGREKL